MASLLLAAWLRDALPHVDALALLVLAAPACATAFALWSAGRWLRKHAIMASSFPHRPRGASLIAGCATEALGTKFHRCMERWANEYGGVVAFRILHQHNLSISDPVLVSEVLAQTGKEYDKLPFIYNIMNSACSSSPHRNLLTGATDEYWRAVRKGTLPAFSPACMRESFPAIAECGYRLADVLRAAGPGAVVDMDDLLSRSSLDIIGHTGFDTDMGALRALGPEGGASAAMRAASACMAVIGTEFANPVRRLRFWSQDVREGEKAKHAFEGIMRGLLADLKTRRAAGKLRRSSIAAHLLEVADPHTGAPLDDVRLVNEITILFFAGFETSGHAQAWMLFAMTQNPEAEARVLAELDALGLLATHARPCPRPLVFEDLGRLVYLNAAIKEALRMYPVFGTARVTKREVLLGGRHRVPAGVNIILNNQAIHTSALNYEEPNRFVPERWLEAGADVARRVDFAAPAAASSPGEPLPGDGELRSKRFFPFSGGPRVCVGRALAHANMTATLATLLGRYTFALAHEMGGPEGARAAEEMVVTMHPAMGMLMHAMPRMPS